MFSFYTTIDKNFNVKIAGVSNILSQLSIAYFNNPKSQSLEFNIVAL